MKLVQIFDKPMCCSTGVCGPQVDPVLPQFAADLEWLKTQGFEVARFNLAQQPQAFIDNHAVHQLLSTEGTDCLPVILVDGAVASSKSYPTRKALIELANGVATKAVLPIAGLNQGCCGSTDCC